VLKSSNQSHLYLASSWARRPNCRTGSSSWKQRCQRQKDSL